MSPARISRAAEAAHLAASHPSPVNQDGDVAAHADNASVKTKARAGAPAPVTQTLPDMS